MDLTVVAYLMYLAIAIPLTVWAARALHRYGEAFLNDVFAGDAGLAHAVNQLLVIGFYLLNLGYVALFMSSHTSVTTARGLVELLSAKVGAVALVVGVAHFANVWAFNAFRRRAVLRARALPPIEPNGYTSVAAPPLPPHRGEPARNGWWTPPRPAQ